METIFNNTEVAFALKSDTELDRAYFLFKLINFNTTTTGSNEIIFL